MSSCPSADPAIDDVERKAWQARQLKELAEIGMELARDIGRIGRAEAEAVEAMEPAKRGTGAAPARGGLLAMAYARVARAVRLTLMLQTRLAEGPPARPARLAPTQDDAAEPTLSPEEWQASARRAGAQVRRFAVIDGVERVIAAASGEAPAAEDENLCESEQFERLKAFDRAFGGRLEALTEDELMDRPTGELVAMICEDLGVPFDPGAWAGFDWLASARAHFAPQIPPRAPFRAPSPARSSRGPP